MVSGSSPLCSEVFVTSLFFPFQIEDLENFKSVRCEIMKNNCILFQEKPEIMSKYRPLFTTCGLYVVKWESSVNDLRICDNSLIGRVIIFFQLLGRTMVDLVILQSVLFHVFKDPFKVEV